jgi:hypothetical protein
MLTMADGVNKVKYPDNPNEHMKIQQWILNSIETFSKTGGI